ncbi:MAG: tyrosine-type recombinase/integrase [Oscillibacter sp.]|nr:tyrosine-type recombinase/integrase [Oscillibacter sp.]
MRLAGRRLREPDAGRERLRIPQARQPGPYAPSAFPCRFKLLLKKGGLPEKLNVHGLRHSNASLLTANSADVATVAGLPGHSQPSAAPDIYTHTFKGITDLIAG